MSSFQFPLFILVQTLPPKSLPQQKTKTINFQPDFSHLINKYYIMLVLTNFISKFVALSEFIHNEQTDNNVWCTKE